MKRLIGLLVILTLACGLLPAYAAGGLTVGEETWYVTPHSDDFRVYYFAEVTNSGEASETVKDLLFEIQDPEGTAIESTSKYKLYPKILKPGETGWLAISQDVKDIAGKSLIDHYALTLTSKEETKKEILPLEAGAEYLAKDADDNEHVLRARVVNNGEADAFSVTAAVAARDAQGKLLYVAAADTGDIGLAAGDALLARIKMKSEVADALADAGTEVASVDAVAYTVADVED